MSRQDSESDSDTSVEAVLRRLDRELDGEPAGFGDLVRTHRGRLASGAITIGVLLATLAFLAPTTVIVIGCVLAAAGAVLATAVVDQDGVTGLGGIRRRLRRRARRASHASSTPAGSRLALWVFPDLRRSRHG